MPQDTLYIPGCGGGLSSGQTGGPPEVWHRYALCCPVVFNLYEPIGIDKLLLALYLYRLYRLGSLAEPEAAPEAISGDR